MGEMTQSRPLAQVALCCPDTPMCTRAHTCTCAHGNTHACAGTHSTHVCTWVWAHRWTRVWKRTRVYENTHCVCASTHTIMCALVSVMRKHACTPQTPACTQRCDLPDFSVHQLVS